jgi:hypothetical protein
MIKNDLYPVLRRNHRVWMVGITHDEAHTEANGPYRRPSIANLQQYAKSWLRGMPLFLHRSDSVNAQEQLKMTSSVP